MKQRRPRTPEDAWKRSDAEWRDPAQVVTQWAAAGKIDPQLLKFKTRGDWWDLLAESRITLLVSREYEHLLMALSAAQAGPEVSFLPLPHPSGIAIDRRRRVVHVASTRNPNQIVDLAPAKAGGQRRTLVPVRSKFLPGRLYLHDLVLMGGELYATAVGENAIIRINADGSHRRVWWPRAIETRRGPRFDQNYLQLNSIAAGTKPANSFFSASSEKALTLRPGHPDFPVDKRGVIFSGATREPVVRGLTRPHSARIYRRKLWVNNSGYGELCLTRDARVETAVRLPGWTRGLAFHKGIAFVGTSRVIPRFRQYAPGLDLAQSECGVHAVDIRSGRVLGSLIWPFGNQIFAIEASLSRMFSGLPFVAARKQPLEEEQKLFYAFEIAR
jgi:uncharacterized protein (TIGR03032 family)